MIISLKNLNMNNEGIINQIRLDNEMRRRMADLGIVKGTIIKPVLKSPCSGIRAYEVRKIILAIRDEEASKIEVIYVEN